MDIQVRLFSILRERAGTARTQLAVPDGATAADALTALGARLHLDGLAAEVTQGRLLLAINREYARPEAVLHTGDELALMPPVAGGAPEVVDLQATGLDAIPVPARDGDRPLAVVLLSGGIDSPVALQQIVADGWDAVAIHMDNRPFTDDMYVEKVKKHVAQVEEATGRSIPLYLAPHGVNQVTIARNLPERGLQCVMCKRQMYRTAEALARKLGASAIVTGESLGQVASQTLHNLQVEDDAVEFPFVRPLLGLDKEEIIQIAKQIGTFEISTIPSLCCTILPDRPATHATLDKVLPLEERIGPEGLLKVSTAGLKRIR